MSEQAQGQMESVTVQQFVDARQLGLDFEILQGEGMNNAIRSHRIQKLGLALAGFAGYIHPDRVQILGGSEMSYLRVLDPSGIHSAVLRLQGQGICCIVITKKLDPPGELLELARRESIPVLRSSEQSSVCIAKIGDYLENQLAPRTTIHGVLLDVFSMGVLLLGPSGIGKSECALELVLKGHRLVTDDFVVITRRGVDRLVGAGGQVLKHHMELRGLGIIDINKLFGISATRNSQTLDFAVRLERYRPDTEYDRLGLEQSKVEFLGVSIPIIEMQVAPGRNVATLIEVAARIQLLRKHGYQPSRELLDILAPEMHEPDKS